MAKVISGLEMNGGILFVSRWEIYMNCKLVDVQIDLPAHAAVANELFFFDCMIDGCVLKNRHPTETSDFDYERGTEILGNMIEQMPVTDSDVEALVEALRLFEEKMGG